MIFITIFLLVINLIWLVLNGLFWWEFAKIKVTL